VLLLLLLQNPANIAKLGNPIQYIRVPMAEFGVEYLTTKELAELLRIKERKVYELAASGKVPCSRATGKLLFPRHAVDAWLGRKSSGLAPAISVQRPTVFLGSHDPLLEWALRESRSGIATFFDGSLDGLERFAEGAGLATALHLYSPATDDWNRAAVDGRFSNKPVALVEFAWRERGLIVPAGKEAEIQGIPSLEGRCIVARQAEAGSQALLEQLLAREGITPKGVNFTATTRTETDAAVAILEGKADAAFGLLGLARQFRLGFVPIIRERFDLLVDRRAWFEPPMQRFLRFCQSADFLERAVALQGYDVAGFGQVHFVGS